MSSKNNSQPPSNNPSHHSHGHHHGRNTKPPTPSTNPSSQNNNANKKKLGGPPGPPAPIPMGLPITPSMVLLNNVDQLEIKQTKVESRNKYSIHDRQGHQLFLGEQRIRSCFSNRFKVMITDQTGIGVADIEESGCCGGGNWIKIFSPPGGGSMVGRIEKRITRNTPKFNIFDAHGTLLIKIKGRIIQTSFGGYKNFRLYTPDEKTEIGKISNQVAAAPSQTKGSSGTRGDNFGLNFPKNLALPMKIVLIGAAIFIDLIYYGHNDNQVNERKKKKG